MTSVTARRDIATAARILFSDLGRKRARSIALAAKSAARIQAMNWERDAMESFGKLLHFELASLMSISARRNRKKPPGFAGSSRAPLDALHEGIKQGKIPFPSGSAEVILLPQLQAVGRRIGEGA